MIEHFLAGYDPEFSMGEDMFKDLELSKELTAEYHEKFGGDEALSVMVLRRSAWPFTARKQDIVLPVWVSTNHHLTRSCA